MDTLLSREIHYNQTHDSRLTPHDLPFKLRPAPTYPFFNYLRYMRYPSLSENIKVDHLLYLVNKSHALPIVIIFLCLGIRVVSQPDTLLYKKQIESLKDHASIQAYLDTIFKRDQTYRGDDAVNLFDLENLISISYFVNIHGYPSIEEYGDASSIAPRMIWVHNSFRELRRLSFPLILKGFESGQISEENLRTYYLRTLYSDRFDDDKNKVIPLPELFELLELNTSDTISIEALIISMAEIRKFNSQPKKEVLTWHGAEKGKWATVNGERKWLTYKTNPVEFVTYENCKMYYQLISVDNSYQPHELQKIGDRKYKLRNQQTDKYFEIDGDGNLLYRNEDEVFDFHKKQE